MGRACDCGSGPLRLADLAAGRRKRMDNRTYYSAFARPREELFLLQRVCYLLCTSLALTAGTAYLSRGLSPGLALPLFIAMLVCIFPLRAAARGPLLNLLLFFGFHPLDG